MPNAKVINMLQHYTLTLQVKKKQTREPKDALQQGGEPAKVTANCTELCGNAVGGKSCSKICPAYVYKNGHPKDKVKVYVVIDDQSNCSLAKPKLFIFVEIGRSNYIVHAENVLRDKPSYRETCRQPHH